MKKVVVSVAVSLLFLFANPSFAVPPFPFWQVCNGDLCTYMDLRDWEPPDYEQRAPSPWLPWELFLFVNKDSPLMPSYERWALDWFSTLLPLVEDEGYTMLDIRVRHDMDTRTSYVLWPGEF